MMLRDFLFKIILGTFLVKCAINPNWFFFVQINTKFQTAVTLLIFTLHLTLFIMSHGKTQARWIHPLCSGNSGEARVLTNWNLFALLFKLKQVLLDFWLSDHGSAEMLEDVCIDNWSFHSTKGKQNYFSILKLVLLVMPNKHPIFGKGLSFHR